MAEFLATEPILIYSCKERECMLPTAVLCDAFVVRT